MVFGVDAPLVVVMNLCRGSGMMVMCAKDGLFKYGILHRLSRGLLTRRREGAMCRAKGAFLIRNSTCFFVIERHASVSGWFMYLKGCLWKVAYFTAMKTATS